MKNRTTSKEIKKLKKNEIFVFGSNGRGDHAGGAAKLAADKFGAVHGVARGVSGQTYALDTMSGLDVLKTQIEPFISVAKEWTDKVFLLTEIGCGIAGFTPEQIAPLFEAAMTVENIHLPESFWTILNAPKSIVGYKGFDKDFKCRGTQYEVGNTYSLAANEKVKACNTGFHFCENPLDIFSYYSPAHARFAEVESKGEIDRDNSDSKVATSSLFIKVEVTLSHIIGIGVKFILDKVDFKNAKESNTGDRSAATNTGNSSAATNTGYRSAATNTGYSSAATNTGDSSAATNTGDRSAATNTGDSSAAIVEGKQSVASALGIESKAKGKIGCWLVLSEWTRDANYDWNRTDVQCKIVDGIEIKEDVFYTLTNGVFTEVK